MVHGTHGTKYDTARNHILCLSSVKCFGLLQNAAANLPATNQARMDTGKEQDRQRGTESDGPFTADDMTPFLEQLQGGEGGDLHQVSRVKQPDLRRDDKIA